MRLVAAVVTVVALAGAAAGCGTGGGGAKASGRVEVAVTDRGFEPSRIEARAGSPVTLVVTRKTDATCAKEIVIAAQNIRQELPLNEAVEVTFTPGETGDIRFACGMDMVSGTIVVK